MGLPMGARGVMQCLVCKLHSVYLMGLTMGARGAVSNTQNTEHDKHVNDWL